MSVPSSVPSRPTGSTRPSGWTTSGSGWPPQARSTRIRPSPIRRCACATVQKRPSVRCSRSALCSSASTPLGGCLVGRAGAQRVAGERGDRGGVRALALHVADQRRPGAAARRVEVVEVAAELDALAGRAGSGRRRTGRGRRAGAPGRSERWRVWAIVRSRSYSWALEIATEASWASCVRIVSSRSENSRSCGRRPRACRARARGRSAAR